MIILYVDSAKIWLSGLIIEDRVVLRLLLEYQMDQNNLRKRFDEDIFTHEFIALVLNEEQIMGSKIISIYSLAY